jgi:hypothetical protein
MQTKAFCLHIVVGVMFFMLWLLCPLEPAGGIWRQNGSQRKQELHNLSS